VTPARVPLMLVPGLLCDAALYAPQVAALADVAAATVVDVTGADSMAGMAREVLAAGPDRFVLLGLSMGGYVAFEVLRRAPERVLAVALLDTSARPDTAEQTARRRRLMGVAAAGGIAAVLDELWQEVVAGERRADVDLRAVVDGMGHRLGPSVFDREQRAIIGRSDSRADLAGIRCPTLVLCGRQDALTPPELSEEIAAGVPGGRLVLVGGCGHLSTLEQPAAVNAALREWLVGAG
jgi:pimeloyl-ACP methyl ester carboxylesterase